jgi:hypothetical protein
MIAAVVLTAMTAGAGATTKCEAPLGTSTFTDPTGDGSGAGSPDITKVVASTYESGEQDFKISFADTDELGSDMLVRTYVDADRNSETGNKDGFEYMIQTQTEAAMGSALSYALDSVECENWPVSRIFTWDGSGWTLADEPGVDSWFGDGSLKLSLNNEKIGEAVSFGLAVYAAAGVSFDGAGNPDLSGAVFDRAPDKGSYDYQPFQQSKYSDPSGDGEGEGAPDITTVKVTKWSDELLNLSVSIPNIEEFSKDMLVRVYIDSDNDVSSGDSNGYDYMIVAQRVGLDLGGSAIIPSSVAVIAHVSCYQPNLSLLEWNGAGWSKADGGSLDWSYREGLWVRLDPSAIGSPKNFAFAVYAASNVSFDESGWPDLSMDPSSDRAPDSGSYAFPLTVAKADLAGVYKVKYKITKAHNFGSLKRGKKITKVWSVKKKCKKRSCKTKVSVKKTKSKYVLSRSGKVKYKAKAGRKHACTRSANARQTERITMKVKKSRWVKGKWRVTKWVGTLKVKSLGSGSSACGRAFYTAKLTATLK